jgi:triosephosphate isomerase
MHLTIVESIALAKAVADSSRNTDGVEIVVCPVFTALNSVAEALKATNVDVGGQNCYHEAAGAFTGEIAPQMLLDAGCRWVIIGHSERRRVIGEPDDLLNRKVRFALDAGINVMFCIGETLDERESGRMDGVLRTQVFDGLNGLTNAQFNNLVLAYEPVWAIGTGVTASPQQAEEAHQFTRGLVAEKFGATIAERLRIQYGGSVKPDNAAELLQQPNVDGALVGGASLNVESFAPIVEAAQKLAAA